MTHFHVPKRKKQPPVPTEEQEQRVVAQYLDLRGDLLWCHVPNGGARNVVTGAKLKGQGVKRGVPDVLVFTARRYMEDNEAIGDEINGLAIELKRQRGGTLSPDQEWWRDRLVECGWRWVRANGAGEAIAAIEESYGKRRSR